MDPTPPRRTIRRNAELLASRIRFQLGGNARLRRHAYIAMKALSGGIGYAAFVEPSLIQTTQIAITIEDLPPALDGYRIAHVSDIHYNIAAGRKFLSRVVERTNALDPDMVALTGDFITHNPRNLHACMGVLGGLRAPDGCWVVRGNHDYRVSMEEMREACGRVGFEILENEHRVVMPSRHRWFEKQHLHAGNGYAEGITVAGVGDLWEGECRPALALDGADPARPAILLAHHGQAAEILPPGRRVDLVLSGHTHGGQVRPMGRSFRMLNSGSDKYVSGLVNVNGTIVYISRGVGTSALRFRWNCLPEVALIILHSGKNH